MFGTGEVDRTLVVERLVDELHGWIFRVLAPSGQSPIDGIDMTHLELVESKRFASGIAANLYAPK